MLNVSLSLGVLQQIDSIYLTSRFSWLWLFFHSGADFVDLSDANRTTLEWAGAEIPVVNLEYPGMNATERYVVYFVRLIRLALPSASSS